MMLIVAMLALVSGLPNAAAAPSLKNLLLPSLADPSAAESTADPTRVTLRVYQQGAYRSGLVPALQPVLTRLLERSGFTLSLVDCGQRAACAKPATDELLLRIVPGRRRANPAICGDALHGDGTRRDVMMTVYRACVSDMTNELHAKAFRPRARPELLRLTEAEVLAPIVIHEAVHLLLPGEHHGTGLWKATLDLNDWELAARAELGLESSTAARVRDALTERGRRAGMH